MRLFSKEPKEAAQPLQSSVKDADARLKSLEDEVAALSQELTTLQKQLNRVERKVYRNTAEEPENENSTSSNIKNLPGMTQGDFSWLQRGWRQ